MIMALHLVTGYKGTAHITSADQGAFNAALIGTEDYVCKNGRQFEAQIMTNNSVRIHDGDLLMQGRHVNLKVDTYEDVTIENGAQGMNRNDLIVCRYAKDATRGQEAALFAVLKGTPTEGTASDPAVTSGDILGGAILHEMPLYRVRIEGLSIVAIEKLFSMVSPVIDVVTEVDLKQHTDNKNNPHGVTAAQVGARPNTWMPTASDVGAVPSSLLGQAVYSSDLMASYVVPTLVRWDSNTINTPTKAGVSECQQGFAIVFGDFNSWHTVVAWCLGGVNFEYLIHIVDNGYDRGWRDMTAFLPLTGGTLNGVLNIYGDSYHHIASTNGQYFGVEVHEHDESGCYRRFYLANNAHSPLENAVHIYDSDTRYKLYGEHNITAGTSDITAGTSELANGCYYDVYE